MSTKGEALQFYIVGREERKKETDKTLGYV
jgi:hypothetical protein